MDAGREKEKRKQEKMRHNSCSLIPMFISFRA